MDIIKTTVGLFQSNAYLLKVNKHVIVVDPGAEFSRIDKNIADDEVVDAVILTHGHIDHIGAVDDFVKKYNCPLYISEKEKEFLTNPNYNLSMQENFTVKAKPLFFSPTTKIGDFTFKIYETPGHSVGSVVILYKNIMFSGDTLFAGSIGRTDLYSGDYTQIMHSLTLFKHLDRNIILYPGHGPNTTINEELKTNPYLRY